MENFDKIIPRKQTNCVKWDSIEKTYHEEDLLPMWVADMDFSSPESVKEALIAVVERGVLGYSFFPDSLYTAIIDWQQRHHNYHVEKEAILFSSGVVPSIALALQAYTIIGDAVLINDPVYHPFANTIKANQRKVVRSPLIERNGHFEFDLKDMEEKIQAEAIKVFILCNPHNPGGRVWRKEELQQVGALCKKYNVLVISDEIHQDLVFYPHIFTTFQNAGEGFDTFSIILTAATKTFNLAGIKNSMVFIQNPELRERFTQQQLINQQHEINTFGIVGTEAAYTTGDAWLADLLIYLKENIQLVADFFEEEFPQVKVMLPEGTYLVWLNFEHFQLSNQEIAQRLIHNGKVVLNQGTMFGPSGSQHARLNIACSKTTLLDGLERIKTAFADLI